MVDYFDELLQRYDEIFDEHIKWQKVAKTMAIEDLSEYVIRLVKEEDGFAGKTEHMKDENSFKDMAIMTAKFKTRYAINRFLASVLFELTLRLGKMILERPKSSKQKATKLQKTVLSKEMKKAIADQVRLEILKNNRKPKSK